MRLRFSLAVAVLIGALAAMSPVSADDGPAFPDLPGMKLADEATRGEVAPAAGNTQSFNTPDAAPASTSKSAASTPDVASIHELPGMGQLPVIGDMKAAPTSSRRNSDAMPRGLAALAALGTIVSVGAFLVFRDRVLGG
ncbi:MAG TPA: hypothetical protein VFA34_02010 [Actinomycetota bacterium]|jgi:hypothetical protein|nr:hypothetical protein [Actinomycetota bacterium]